MTSRRGNLSRNSTTDCWSMCLERSTGTLSVPCRLGTSRLGRGRTSPRRDLARWSPLNIGRTPSPQVSLRSPLWDSRHIQIGLCRLAFFRAGSPCIQWTSAQRRFFRQHTKYKQSLHPRLQFVPPDSQSTRADPCRLETCPFHRRCTPSTALREPLHQQRTVRKQSILFLTRSCRPSNRHNLLVPSPLEKFLGRSRYKRWTSCLGRRCQPHTECTKSPWRSELWIRLRSPRTCLALSHLGTFLVCSRCS